MDQQVKYGSGVITPEAFAGSDSERINQAMRAAAEAGGSVVIPKINRRGAHREVWLLDEAILLPGHMTVTLDGCRLKLSDRCRDNFFRSANCGVGIADIRPLEQIHLRGVGGARLEGADHPRATGDSAKVVGERSYGTDAGVEGESQRSDWRNIGILLASVNHFSIENLTIIDSHCWAISLEYCAHGRLRDLAFDSTEHRVIDGQPVAILNQDGIDLRQGCHDILIENISGRSGDDLIALTAIPHAGRTAGGLACTMISAANDLAGIHHIIIRNVRGHCAGGHHIVRFLNTRGAKLHDILLDGLLDTSTGDPRSRAAVKIGDGNPVWGGYSPLGDTSRIIINNVISRARDTILIDGSLTDAVISNIIKYDGDGDPITILSGPEYLRNVTVQNARTAGE